MLIVNTASKCGFTSQYRGLQELYADYAPRGFTVLGFPCNQFLHQEPGTADQIATFCHENYSVTFPMFEKIDVNGPFAHPLYQWLVGQAPGKSTLLKIRSEEHTSELQSLMRNSYAVFCLKKKKPYKYNIQSHNTTATKHDT